MPLFLIGDHDLPRNSFVLIGLVEAESKEIVNQVLASANTEDPRSSGYSSPGFIVREITPSKLSAETLLALKGINESIVSAAARYQEADRELSELGNKLTEAYTNIRERWVVLPNGVEGDG
jgi:hypothetical protein